MVGVGNVHGAEQVLKDICLGCFNGAKIGVFGLNGSGKPTRPSDRVPAFTRSAGCGFR